MDLKDKSLFIQKCFINGHWLDAESEEIFDVMNPSDQTKVGTCLLYTSPSPRD